MRKSFISALILGAAMVLPAQAADYVIDDKGAHAAINFKVNHMGFSYVTGRFNKFNGTFTLDEKDMSKSKVSVTVDTTSIDSNHAERDKHVRSGDFLDASKFGKATFVSTSVKDKGNGKVAITGDLTLHGVKKSIVIDAVKVGEGDDPWGGHRAGFAGSTSISMKDFGLAGVMDFGDITFDLHVEGIKQ
ncbi:MAG: YceI family protein [Thalassotalea sp.]|nr:YceI family protein [Thalassotalea sp.]